MDDEQRSDAPPTPPPMPPAFAAIIEGLKTDRKKLMRDKAFKDSVQLREFLGQFLIPRLIEITTLFAHTGTETWGLAVHNNQGLRQLSGHLQRIDEDIDRGASVSPEVLDAFQAAFYALGTYLQKKYPEDVKLQEHYNAVAKELGVVVDELMSFDYDDDDDRDDDDRDDDDDDDRDDDDRDDDDDDDRDDDDRDDDDDPVNDQEGAPDAEGESEGAVAGDAEGDAAEAKDEAVSPPKEDDNG